MVRQIVSLVIVVSMVLQQIGFAQLVPQPSIPAYLQEQLNTERFRPMHLRSIAIDRDNGAFDLLVDKGDSKNSSAQSLEETSRRLLQYFKIGLRLPNTSFWVNLRPDSANEIIDSYLERTEMGKVILEADLQLKHDIARFTNPDTKEGKVYWTKLYAKAEELFSGDDVEVPTMTRPWIVPGEIILGQSQQGVYIYKATLKVMLEQDYLKEKSNNFSDPRLQVLNEYSSQLVRELIIPKLTKAVNSSKRYADLRQVYYSLILAQWYKNGKDIPDVVTKQLNTRDLSGLTSKTSWSKETFFKAYKHSFDQGEYSKEETVRSPQGIVIRRYFSGGANIVVNPAQMTVLQMKVSRANFFANSYESLVRYDAAENVRVLPREAGMANAAELNAEAAVLKKDKDGGFDLQDTDLILKKISELNESVALGVAGQPMMPEFGRNHYSNTGRNAIIKAALLGQVLPGVGTPHIALSPDRDNLVGYSVYGLLPNEMLKDFPDNAAYIYFVATHPDYRGQGVGERLFKQTVDFAHRMGVNQVVIDVRVDSPYRSFFDKLATMYPASVQSKQMGPEKVYRYAYDVRDGGKPDVVILSGGAASRLLVPILNNLGNKVRKIVSLLTNVDDGGATRTLIDMLIDNGYGITPPVGDQVNALFNSFMTPDKIFTILDDSGRIKPGYLGLSKEELLKLGTLEEVLRVAFKLSRERDLLFAEAIDSMRSGDFQAAEDKLGKIKSGMERIGIGNNLDLRYRDGEYLLKNAQEKQVLSVQALEQIRESNLGLGMDFAEYERNMLHFAKIIDTRMVDRHGNNLLTMDVMLDASHSIRNLLLIAAWLEQRLLQEPPPFQDGELVNAFAAEEQMGQYRQSLDSLTEKFGIDQGGVSISSVEPTVVYARYQDNVLAWKEGDKQHRLRFHAYKNSGKGKLSVWVDRSVAGATVVGPLGNASDDEEFILDPGQKVAITTDDTIVDVGFDSATGNATFDLIDRKSVGKGDRFEVQENESGDTTRLVRNYNDSKRVLNDNPGMYYDEAAKKDKAITFMGRKPGDVIFVPRFIATQTYITETVNFSKIIEYGFADWGTKGQTGRRYYLPKPDRRISVEQTNPAAVKAIDDAQKYLISGPGSFFTSILSHLRCDGIVNAMVNARKRGVKSIFIFNANQDNETVGLTLGDMIKHVEKASKRKFEELFDEIIIGSRIDYMVLLDEYRQDAINQSYSQSDAYPVDAAEVKAMVEMNLKQHPDSVTRLGLDVFKSRIDQWLKDNRISAPVHEDRYEWALSKYSKADEIRETVAQYAATFVEKLYGDIMVEIRNAGGASGAAKMSRGLLQVEDAVFHDLQNRGVTIHAKSMYGLVTSIDRGTGKSKASLGYLQPLLENALRDVVDLDGKEFFTEMQYIMDMFGIKDTQRVIQLLLGSTDPNSFIENLSKVSDVPVNKVNALLAGLDNFKPFVSARTVRLNELNPVKKQKINDFQKRANYLVEVSADGYLKSKRARFDQDTVKYLDDRRGAVKTVPFEFRDNMEEFVNSFLGQGQGAKNDLKEILEGIQAFFAGLEESDVKVDDLKYVITSGIGANEMFSHQLANVLNEVYPAVKWIVVNNPAHMGRIPGDADSANSVVFEMSRSGTTKETVDFFNATKNQLRNRIVVSEGGLLGTAANELEKEGNSNVFVVTGTPGNIGGRQMNRKTLMVFAPLFIALYAKTKSFDEAKKLLAEYVQGLLDANNELAYGQNDSGATDIADFLYAQRVGGRNKFSIIYDTELQPIAAEFIQFINEGANKNISGGTNNNIIIGYDKDKEGVLYKRILKSSPATQMPILLVNEKSNFSELTRFMDSLDIPYVVVKLQGSDKIRDALKTHARLSALMQDAAVYYTYLTNQDANSNPAVKLVREITAGMFEVLKEKKQSNSDVRMGFEEVLEKVAQSQAQKFDDEGKKLNLDRIERNSAGSGFRNLNDQMRDVCSNLNISEEQFTAALMGSINEDVFKADMGEVNGTSAGRIDQAFERSRFKGSLGGLTEKRSIVALEKQEVVFENADLKISVASDAVNPSLFTPQNKLKTYSHAVRNEVLSEEIAGYLFNMWQGQGRDKSFEQFALSCMEVSENSPVIQGIREKIVEKFADLNVTVPVIALPRLAHSGVEAIMSHPENIFNIAVMETDSDPTDVGTAAISAGVTVNDATYVYGISNVIRMAVGGTPTVIIEVKDIGSEGDTVKEIVGSAIDRFRDKIKNVRDGGENKQAVGEQKWSPDKQYYIQKVRTYNPVGRNVVRSGNGVDWHVDEDVLYDVYGNKITGAFEIIGSGEFSLVSLGFVGKDVFVAKAEGGREDMKIVVCRVTDGKVAVLYHLYGGDCSDYLGTTEDGRTIAFTRHTGTYDNGDVGEQYLVIAVDGREVRKLPLGYRSRFNVIDVLNGGTWAETVGSKSFRYAVGIGKDGELEARRGGWTPADEVDEVVSMSGLRGFVDSKDMVERFVSGLRYPFRYVFKNTGILSETEFIRKHLQIVVDASVGKEEIAYSSLVQQNMSWETLSVLGLVNDFLDGESHKDGGIEKEIGKIFAGNMMVRVNAPKGLIIKEDGQHDYERVYDAALKGEDLNGNRLRLEEEIINHLKSVGPDGFIKIVREYRVKKNLKKNEKKGLAITTVSGLPFGKESDNYTSFIEMLNEVRDSLVGVLGWESVAFNEEKDGEALHMTLQAITRTKNMGAEVDIEESFNRVKQVVEVIQKNLSVDLPAIHKAISKASRQQDAEMIREWLTRAQLFTVAVLIERNGEHFQFPESVFNELSMYLDYFLTLSNDDLLASKEYIQEVAKKAKIEINGQPVYSLEDGLLQLARSHEPFMVEVKEFGYFALDGELSFSLEPVSQTEGDVLKLVRAFGALPTEAKAGNKIHFSLGRVTRPLEDEEIIKINQMTEKFKELGPITLNDLKIVLYLHRSLTEIIDVYTYKLGEKNDEMSKFNMGHMLEKALFEIRKEKNKDGGFEVQQPVGGVDFRVLPATAELNVSGAKLVIPPHMVQATQQDLNKCWQRIQQKIQSGPVPYTELRDYAVTVANRQDCAKQALEIAEYVGVVLRMEEDAAVETSTELKEILATVG